MLHGDIERILFDAETIDRRIRALGREIAQDFAGEDLVMLALLKGSVIFLADLMREIDRPLEIEFAIASSYGASTKSSGQVALQAFPKQDWRDRCVLVVDDILDSGRTLAAVTKRLQEDCQPKRIKTCVLLDKEAPRAAELSPSYAGFRVEDVFVVGYGLDYAGRYRNLPYIGVLKEECWQGKAPT